MFHLWVLISYLKTYSKLLANKFNLRFFKTFKFIFYNVCNLLRLLIAPINFFIGVCIPSLSDAFGCNLFEHIKDNLFIIIRFISNTIKNSYFHVQVSPKHQHSLFLHV